ncbi:MAG TPA: inorganic diphosphatase [Candidatus Gracilibacteria bacterium]
MNLFTNIPLRGKKPNTFHAVVEIPKGSKVKMEYNEDLGVMSVDRMFRTPCGYPHNYGFFPQSWNKYDKDPMDVIIIARDIIPSGTLCPIRVVGMIEMDDSGELDHKIIGVCHDDEYYDEVTNIDDPKMEMEVGHLVWFMSHYKERQKKEVKILGVKGASEALKFLEECEAEYKNHHA